MQWCDFAIVLSVRKYAENASIVTLLTREFGLHQGLVKGANGPKLRAIYQIGNYINVTWRGRLAEQLGFLTGELCESSAMILFSDGRRLAALGSICAILQHSLEERQKEEALFVQLYQFIALLKTDAPWISNYIHFELQLLANLGFGLDLSECAATGEKDDLLFISPKTGKAVSRIAGEPYKDKLLPLPHFLKSMTPAETPSDIRQGLQITGYFLEKWNFMPRNKKLPAARRHLEELLNS